VRKLLVFVQPSGDRLRVDAGVLQTGSELEEPAGGVHRVRADESARDRAHRTERRAGRRGDNSDRGLEVNERALVATLDLVMFPHDSEDRPPRAAEVASLLPVSNSVPNERAARECP
jgi:hypothetical protein